MNTSDSVWGKRLSKMIPAKSLYPPPAHFNPVILREGEKATVQTRGKAFEISALRPFSMGKAAEEAAEVKAQNEDFSKKALRLLDGSQVGIDDTIQYLVTETLDTSSIRTRRKYGHSV